jgi:hypothetical protein
MVELDGNQSDGDGQVDDQVLQIWKIRKRKQKNLWAQDKGINKDFVLPVKTQ